MGLKNLIFDVPWFFVNARSVLHNGFRVEKEFIAGNLSGNSKVLDFGCGTGQFSVLAANYAGVDIEGPHIRYAMRKFPEKDFAIFGADFSVPIESERFEAVFCIHVVHHVPPDGERVFREEVLRLLKTGGRILIVDHFPIANQGSVLSRFLLSIDRGKYPRLPEETATIFGASVRMVSKEYVKSGPYSMYLLVLEKL
jgi:SAM-dependent methyltransferase